MKNKIMKKRGNLDVIKIFDSEHGKKLWNYGIAGEGQMNKVALTYI